MNKIIYPFERGQFLCSDNDCHVLFHALRDDIFEEDGDFFAKCDGCGKDGIETHHMKNLHKTLGSAKGANMSDEGKNKSRLNGFTTGSTALSKYHEGKIPMPPAKPGKYAECDGCQDKESCHLAVIDAIGTCRPIFCHRKGEVNMKYIAAFLENDPEKLSMMAAMNAASMQQVLNNSFRTLFERGVEIVEEIVYKNKEGDIEKTTEKIYAHPLIKQCVNIMQMMGYSLTEWTMTRKSKEAKDQVAGFLAASIGNGVPLEEVTEKIDNTVKNFGSLLQKAAKLRSEDKTLQVFEIEEGKREADE